MASAPVEPDAAANGVGSTQMGPARPNHVVEADGLPPELGLPTAAALLWSASWQQQIAYYMNIAERGRLAAHQ